MRVTSLHTETSLTAIAERLYANLTDGSRKLAESALLNANPSLGKPDGFRPGAIIQVPTLPAAALKTTDISHEDPIRYTREILVDAITRYQMASKETFSSNQADIEKQMKLFDQTAFTKALNNRDTPIMGKEIKSELTKRRQENEIRANNLMAALDLAINDLRN